MKLTPEERRRQRTEMARRWRRDNPDKCRDAKRRYVEKHKDEINAKLRAKRYASGVKPKIKLSADEKRLRHNARLRRWRAANPEKSKEYSRKYRQDLGLEGRSEQFRRYREQLAQRPRPDHCEVCGHSDTTLEFDHCHQRGVFRGWLCGPCNRALGCVRDDANILRKLIAYLERTKDLIPPQLTLPV